MGARHASSAKGISSTYVLRLINICSTPHQHMFYASSTYVLRLINICSTSHQHMFYFHQHIFYVSSTRDQHLIYEGSTSHLRRIDVSSTRDFEEKRKYMFRLSPNQVLLAAFSCTKQVDGKPKQLAWACHLLAKYLPSPCEVLAISLRNPGLSFTFLFLISLDSIHRVKLNCLSTSLTSY